MRTVCIEPSKMIVDRELWSYIKGELGPANAEVLLLDAHGALLTKCNNRLERQRHELTSSNTSLRRKHRQLHTDDRESLFHAGRHRHVLLHIVEDMQSIFKDELVQLLSTPASQSCT